MGEYNSTYGIIGVLAYFFLFYLAIHATLSSDAMSDSNNDLKFDNPGFQTINDGNIGVSGDSYASVQADSGYASITTVLSAMSGIGTANIQLGIPVSFVWVFHFIFFWVPFAILLMSAYFALPWVH